MQAAPLSPKVAWDRSTLMTSPSTPSTRFASDVMAGVRAQEWVEAVIGRSLEGSFAEALKDGQGLCCLVNKIRPGTIARIETSTSPFKQMANISSFIRGCKTLGVRETSLFETLDLYNEKRLSQVARCLFSLSEVARRTMPDFPGPHLSAPDRPEVDPAVKAVVDIAKGNTPTPPWATKAPTPVTPRKMAGSADGFNAAGKSHTVHSGSVLGTPSRSVHLTLPNREKFTAAYEPGCSLSPAAHAAGQLTYGIYEGGGGCSTPLAVPTESFFVAGRTHVDSNDCTPHRSRDGAGCSNGADGHQTDTNTGKVLRRALSREEELRRRKQAVARVDAEMEVALWIEGVTGVTFPGKFWSSLKDGVLLCQVINAIKPELIPTINTVRAPFPEMENISAFLAACRTLGVAEHSLFDTKDLHEKRDLQLVVRCLRVLGATVQTTVPSFRGPFLGKKSEACSTLNARGLRKRLGKGPGAQGGVPLAGLKECYVVDDTKNNVAAGSTNKKDGFRTGNLNADHGDGNETATITPAESPSGGRGLFNPAVSGSAAGSAALEAASAKLEASHRSLSPPPPKGLLARVSSPLKGTSPLGRKWRRTTPRTPQKNIGAGEGDFVPSLILEDVPEGTVPEVTASAETRPVVRGGVPGEMGKVDPHPEELVFKREPEPDKTAAERVLREARDVAADSAGGGSKQGDYRDANVRSQDVITQNKAEHVDDEWADVVAQVQAFVERNTRMPWRVDGDMFESLRDGWQLGLLANSLRPGAIRRVHNSIMPAKHVHNISNFVTACRRMGVASSQLFDVPDLYAKLDLTKVSRTLLSLRALAADPDFAHAQRRSSLMESSLLKSAAARAAAHVGILENGGFWATETQ